MTRDPRRADAEAAAFAGLRLLVLGFLIGLGVGVLL
jgi:hypothetical protein